MTASSRLKGYFVQRYLGGRLGQKAKRIRNRGKKVTFFYRVDDPYSHLAAQTLSKITERYGTTFEWVIVPEPSVDVNPEPILQAAYARRDCAVIAAHLGLSFPKEIQEPTADRLRRANAILIHPRNPDQQIEAAIEVGEAVWRGDGKRLAKAGQRFGTAKGQAVNPTLEQGHRRLRKEGHYQSAMFLYNGDWFWGVDRLQHLSDAIAKDQKSECAPLFQTPQGDVNFTDQAIDFFFSFRSPYSYIAIERLCRLGGEFPIRLKPVLPMVSRGFSVPTIKKMYILRDAHREAARHNIPFGKISDPLPGVARCLAIFYQADLEGKGLEFARTCFSAVWSEAADVTSDADLLRIVESIGWDKAKLDAALADQSFRAEAEQNRLDLRKQGLWGVPSFAIAGDPRGAFWGQDRLALVDRRLSDPALYAEGNFASTART